MPKGTVSRAPLQALKGALRSKQPGKLYFFYGEEGFLLQYYMNQLRKVLLDELTQCFNEHRLTTENFSVRGLLEAVENLPMMAQRTLVQVDDVDLFRLPEEERSRIAQLFSDLPEYCTLVFTYTTVPWKPDKRQKALWEAIERHGNVVEFARQEQRDLISWVVRHFAAQGKRIDTGLANYLIDITGGSMTALSGEITKIAAYSGAEDIRKSDIDAVTEPVLDAVVFQMTDLLGQAQYGAAIQKLQQLLKMQNEPLAILGAIGGHFRRLGAARTLRSSGKGAAELMRLYGMPEYAAKKTMAAAGRFSERFCASAARLVLETDYRMKTSFDDPQRLLEMLILQLAQEAPNG